MVVDELIVLQTSFFSFFSLFVSRFVQHSRTGRYYNVRTIYIRTIKAISVASVGNRVKYRLICNRTLSDPMSDPMVFRGSPRWAVPVDHHGSGGKDVRSLIDPEVKGAIR